VNPDVVSAIARLRAQAILSAEQAVLFDRVARRRLVSVRGEIRALLYIGILLATSGVGLLVAERHRDIGPWIIAAAIGAAAAGCLVWVARAAAPFSWGEARTPNAAFDYVLLLGLLLLASDLAYIEIEWSLLGRQWTHHLLLVAAVYLVAAYRWDSRTILALGLTTLAAWRGVSVDLASGSIGRGDTASLRVNAIVLGALYLAAAWHAVRQGRKAHFEDVFANAGLVLVLGALVSGALGGPLWPAWLIALLAVAGAVMGLALWWGRSLYFVQGVAAAYVGLLRLVFTGFHRPLAFSFLLAALLGIGALVLVFAAHRRMRER
jgi:hypothetical protein